MQSSVVKVRFSEALNGDIAVFAEADRRSSVSDAIRVLVQLGLEAWRAGATSAARSVVPPDDGVFRGELPPGVTLNRESIAALRELTAEPVREDWA